MSVVEADLDNDGGLGEEAYLNVLVQRAPHTVSLPNNLGRLQLFKWFLIFVAPDDADGDGNNGRTLTHSLRGLPALLHYHTETFE